jgi:hypothetical protein
MSRAVAGYGSKLYYSLDQSTYLNVVQLQRISPAGSKQRMVDQTNLRTPDNFTRPMPVQVDSGEIDITGVYSGDPSQFALAGCHGSMQLVYFRLVLSDGTIYNFAAYVSEFKPWEVVYSKFIPFSAKLRIVGGIQVPSSGFQGNAFGNGFQVDRVLSF